MSIEDIEDQNMLIDSSKLITRQGDELELKISDDLEEVILLFTDNNNALSRKDYKIVIEIPLTYEDLDKLGAKIFDAQSFIDAEKEHRETMGE